MCQFTFLIASILIVKKLNLVLDYPFLLLLLTVFGSAFIHLVNLLSKAFDPPVIRDNVIQFKTSQNYFDGAFDLFVEKFDPCLR